MTRSWSEMNVGVYVFNYLATARKQLSKIVNSANFKLMLHGTVASCTKQE